MGISGLVNSVTKRVQIPQRFDRPYSIISDIKCLNTNVMAIIIGVIIATLPQDPTPGP